MRKLLLLPLLLTALLASGCGGGGKGEKTTATEAAVTIAAPEKDAAGCVITEAPAPRGPGKEEKPALRLDENKTYVVTVKTNCGDIPIELDVARAPRTAASFAALVQNGFYDGLIFHRVIADFVIQGGDPLGNGQGGPGYNVVEKPPADLKYRRGIVAMAKAGVDPPGASGSQFFIVTAQDAGLPPDYALVGKVVQGGMSTVNRIAAEPVEGPNSIPVNDIVIESATIEPAP